MWRHSDEKYAHSAREVIAVTQLDTGNGCFTFILDGYYDCDKC